MNSCPAQRGGPRCGTSAAASGRVLGQPRNGGDDGALLGGLEGAAVEFLLIPIGSSGDVHPFVAIGLALKRRGHSVTIYTNGHFEPLVRRVGLDFLPLGTADDFQAAIANPAVWHPVKGFKAVADWAIIRPMRQVFEAIRERSTASELVLVAPVMAFGARLAREALGLPLATVNLQPATFRSVHQSPAMPGLAMPDRLPKTLKRWLYRLGDAVVADPALVPGLNAYRAELGLPPVRRPMQGWWWSPDLVLNLFPAWYAPPQPDWPTQAVMTGFPLYDEGDAGPLPAEVAAFLDAGEPPVAFTLGSAMKHGHAFFAAAVEACRRLGRRGILLTGYPEQLPAGLPEGVRHFAYVPFGRLLPRVAALVHHGGIGTTAQALAAGVPQLIMPMAHDQPDNAARVCRLGVGRSIPRGSFRGPAVARTLGALLGSTEVHARCREVAGRFAGVDPIDEACRALEGLAGRPM